MEYTYPSNAFCAILYASLALMFIYYKYKSTAESLFYYTHHTAE